MNIASITSPFTNTEETPWIVWKRQDRVSVLQEQIQSNENLASAPQVNPPEFPPILPAPPINRMQYNTVMNRMVQASKKTGNFAAWTL